jgi:hypothetical protein
MAAYDAQACYILFDFTTRAASEKINDRGAERENSWRGI